MFDNEKKKWNAPPPLYDCIVPSETKKRIDLNGTNNNTSTTTFHQYMTISKNDVVDSRQQHQQQNSKYEDSPFGRIYSLSQLIQRFGIHK
ncbi:unnamed protein product [Pseudo-nitzschia multistriata]|uniref:Uncharacterized protein n=1 Tax=Pseudo-nitzschia multistriata TaxID=183589 RepID=A0A448ZKQ2_9STRA|nr:unnamed protein product [Pseudo-nitzschia multistriata]